MTSVDYVKATADKSRIRLRLQMSLILNTGLK